MTSPDVTDPKGGQASDPGAPDGAACMPTGAPDLETPDPGVLSAAPPARTRIRRFLSCRDGAVTVDWVVLTAAFAGLGVAVGAMLYQNVGPEADSLGAFLSDQAISTSF